MAFYRHVTTTRYSTSSSSRCSRICSSYATTTWLAPMLANSPARNLLMAFYPRVTTESCFVVVVVVAVVVVVVVLGWCHCCTQWRVLQLD